MGLWLQFIGLILGTIAALCMLIGFIISPSDTVFHTLKIKFMEKKINKVNIEDSSLNQSPIIVDSPGAQVTYQIPETQLKAEVLKESELVNDKYVSEILLEVIAPYPIKNLYLEAHADTILDLDTIPQRSGIDFTGHRGKRDGYAFTNIPNAHGSYKVVVVTQTKESVKLLVRSE